MYKKHTLLGAIWRHGILLAVVAFSLFPVIWVMSASFDPSNTLVGQRLIPRNASLANYQALFNDPLHPFGLWMWNSIKISFITSVFVVFLTSLAAYAFSRFKFKGRREGLFGMLIVQVFPQVLAMVAIYLLLLRIGDLIPALGLNTHGGLILVYLGGAMGVNTWLMKGYFDTIPRSLEESAFIDGASRFRAFTSIIIPLARPILAVIFILSFIGTYSEFILARILLSSKELLTIPVALQIFIDDQYGKRWGVFSAGALMAAVPIITMFILSQRHMVSGLVRGAVKE